MKKNTLSNFYLFFSQKLNEITELNSKLVELRQKTVKAAMGYEDKYKISLTESYTKGENLLEHLIKLDPMTLKTTIAQQKMRYQELDKIIGLVEQYWDKTSLLTPKRTWKNNITSALEYVQQFDVSQVDVSQADTPEKETKYKIMKDKTTKAIESYRDRVNSGAIEFNDKQALLELTKKLEVITGYKKYKRVKNAKTAANVLGGTVIGILCIGVVVLAVVSAAMCQGGVGSPSADCGPSSGNFGFKANKKGVRALFFSNLKPILNPDGSQTCTSERVNDLLALLLLTAPIALLMLLPPVTLLNGSNNHLVVLILH